MLSTPRFAPPVFAGADSPYRMSYRASSGACAAGSFFFFRGIKMYQDNNMLEKARERHITVAMIAEHFFIFRVWS